MSAPAAILSKPTTTSSSSRYPFPIPTLKSLKIVSISQIPPSELLFHREFVSRKPISLRRGARSRNTMNGSTTNATSDSGFGASSCSSAGDEGVSAFEQESLINHGSSSEFRPYFTAVGLESTLNRASKWLVTALFGAVLLWRHDGESLWAAMGSVVNVGLSTLLKQLLNQQRPISTLRSDPGMPSSHAQSIFFIIIFAVVSLLQWLGANGLTITLSCLALAFASYLSWLRVSQHLHTISQVVVGAVIGSTFSILWFWLWDAIVLKAFISYLWVRIMVILGAAGFSVGFVVHVIRYWFVNR